MQTLREKLFQTSRFLVGTELVSVRGGMGERSAVKARDFANELIASPDIDWISITDNAGGNPQLAPMALGKPILYAGKEVVIHLTCKDLNRNGLESEAWLLNSEGFHNILAMTGDYPVVGTDGQAKPVFDIDSVGLVSMLNKMNHGLDPKKAQAGGIRQPLGKTEFCIGAVTTNFKLHEGEVMPQYFKLQKKIEAGAQFIINQIGFDTRKISELRLFMDTHGMTHVPLIGNVYLFSSRVAQIFYEGRIPGVVVTKPLLDLCMEHAASPDGGKAFFLEFAAKQMAIYRGLGVRGVYLGGVHSFPTIEKLLAIERSFAPDDWRQFAKEIKFSRPGEFYFHAEDLSTGLADAGRREPVPATASKHLGLAYRLSHWSHTVAFTPGRALAKWGAKACARAADPAQGPKPLRLLEHLSKAALFQCKDCGDCSLAEIAFLCPESQCAKNQRNGPCGGTREGRCEVDGYGDCIWLRAYERLKHDGNEDNLLQHAPVVQNQALRGTSAWANFWLGRDHTAKPPGGARRSARDDEPMKDDGAHGVTPRGNPPQSPATATRQAAHENSAMTHKKLHIIGELMNNSYARARRAFTNRDPKAYQELAKLQTDLGADFLTLNLDGTQQIQVRREEMLGLLPDVIRAVQEATSTPIAFDNPSVEYHRAALKHYDRNKSGAPILNSVAASREHLDEMIELVKHYDTLVIVMASERFAEGGASQCLNPRDSYEAAKHFVELLATKAGRRNDQIIIDPGLAPVGADTYGLVNIGLDAMKLIRADPDLKGVHLVVGLSNFAWGTPKGIREELEKAYLTLGMEAGLDFALCNPEKTPGPLPKNHPMVANLREALEQGRAGEGETHETAGYRQAEAIMAICNEAMSHAT